MSSYEIKTLGEYQRLTERFEKVNDGYIMPDSYAVVRIDAHRFGAEWDHENDSTYPFQKEMLSLLIDAAHRLMCLDVRVRYVFIHGDEISLLLDPLETQGLRRRAKLISYFSSVGATFVRELSGKSVFFEAKLSELPTEKHVFDYFFWQRRVAFRNYFSRVLGVLLNEQRLSAQDISQKLTSLSDEEKILLADDLGHSYEDIPRGFLFGSALWWRATTTDDGPKAVIVASEAVPGTDERYLEFLEHRLNAPSFLVSNPGEIAPRETFDPHVKEAPRPVDAPGVQAGTRAGFQPRVVPGKQPQESDRNDDSSGSSPRKRPPAPKKNGRPPQKNAKQNRGPRWGNRKSQNSGD